MTRLLLLLLALILIYLLLAWFGIVPGGWRLRDLFEDPVARDRRLALEHREERLALFARESARIRPGTILFIGSSTLERFPLSSCFPGKDLLNRGIGGEPARLMISRLEASLPALGRADLGGALLYAGTIDFRKERVSAEEAGLLVERLAIALREKTRADLPLLVLGPLPGNEDDDRYRGPAMLELEEALRVRAAAIGADFLPLARPPFRAEDGGLEQSLAVDRWHLAEEGYVLLADLIRREGGRVGALLR